MSLTCVSEMCSTHVWLCRCSILLLTLAFRSPLKARSTATTSTSHANRQSLFTRSAPNATRCSYMFAPWSNCVFRLKCKAVRSPNGACARAFTVTTFSRSHSRTILHRIPVLSSGVKLAPQHHCGFRCDLSHACHHCSTSSRCSRRHCRRCCCAAGGDGCVRCIKARRRDSAGVSVMTGNTQKQFFTLAAALCVHVTRDVTAQPEHPAAPPAPPPRPAVLRARKCQQLKIADG